MRRPTAIVAGAVAAAVLALVGVVVLIQAGPTPQPPDISAPSELRAVVGERLEHRFEAAGVDSGELLWTARGLPPGARLAPDGHLTWAPGPQQAGTWSAEVTATDADGLAATAEVAVLGRHRPRPTLYLALGDSVASGHGLRWRSYLGRDPCWRDRGQSYPARVLEEARGAGVAVEELALVACSGHHAADLRDRPVDGGPDLGAGPGDDGGDGPGERSQIEWAVVANPGLVTLTIGANDLGFATPEDAVTAGGELDEGYVSERLDRVEAGLDAALRRLVDATDSRILVTTYHDPTAERPHGVDGCREDCFRAITGEVVARLNARITAVAERFPSDRVAVADVSAAFAGRGAPNGLGPDALRGWQAPGWVPSALTWTSGIHAYCAAGRPDGPPTYVSSLDCVHPNAAGARAYAEVVLEAWAGTGWTGAPGR